MDNFDPQQLPSISYLTPYWLYTVNFYSPAMLSWSITLLLGKSPYSGSTFICIQESQEFLISKDTQAALETHHPSSSHNALTLSFSPLMEAIGRTPICCLLETVNWISQYRSGFLMAHHVHSGFWVAPIEHRWLTRCEARREKHHRRKTRISS